LRAAWPISAARDGRGIEEAILMSLETWTTERVEQLRSYIGSGLTCSQIAAQIGVTRNAVLGKIHRLGLSLGRPPGAAAQACPPRSRQPRAPRRRRSLQLLFPYGTTASNPAAALAPVTSVEPCSLLDLANDKCRWPLGETAGAGNLLFCGNATIEGLSYCAGHARMAYRISARRGA
jgi:GcrA cell cycle regulator